MQMYKGMDKEAKNINPSSPKRHLEEARGHKIQNVGNKPNSWTDCEQMWHTYADPAACEWT